MPKKKVDSQPSIQFTNEHFPNHHMSWIPGTRTLTLVESSGLGTYVLTTTSFGGEVDETNAEAEASKWWTALGDIFASANEQVDVDN